MILFSLIPLLLVIWLLRELGWFTGPQAWARATGWNRIPERERPAVATRVGMEEPVLHWLGHSGFLVLWRGVTLLLDPHTENHCTVARRVLEPAADPGALDHVDAVLISHAHFDHLNLMCLRHLRALPVIAVPAGSEGYLDGLALPDRRIAPLRLHERLSIGSLEVIAVPASHHGNRYHPWRSAKGAIGYIVRDAHHAVYFAGDTSAANDFAAIRDRYHPRVAVLPIGAFLPRDPLKDYHLSPEEAVAAARTLEVRCVMPCHFGTFRLSWDRPDVALPRFARAAREAGVAWVMPSLWRGSR